MPTVPLLAEEDLPIPPGAARILGEGARSGKLTHLEHVPAASGRRVDWPGWAAHAAAGRNVIISTGPASGKSLGYLLPALTEVLNGGTALYLSPTRALAADQLRTISSLGIPRVRAAVVDADTGYSERN